MLSQLLVDFGCKTEKQRFTKQNKTKHFIALFSVLEETSCACLDSLAYLTATALLHIYNHPHLVLVELHFPASKMAQPTAVRYTPASPSLAGEY